MSMVTDHDRVMSHPERVAMLLQGSQKQRGFDGPFRVTMSTHLCVSCYNNAKGLGVKPMVLFCYAAVLALYR